MKDLGSSASSATFVAQGLQDERTRFIHSAIFRALACFDEQSFSRCFVILTLLSRLGMFCFCECQGQRSSSLINKILALIDIQTIPSSISIIAD